MPAEAFLGEIVMLPYGNRVPDGWNVCDGSKIPISQNEALYSLIGTKYGGDGSTYFCLPNLQCRMPVGAGSLPSQNTSYQLGQAGGAEAVALTMETYPTHTHVLNCRTDAGTDTNPSGNVLASAPANINLYVAGSTAAKGSMDPQTIQPEGNGLSHQNMSPFLAVVFIICVQGLYPARP